MATKSIQHWCKTVEGIEIIESQKRFCIGGGLWQGHKMTPIVIAEVQLTDKELEDTIDIDGTLDRVWFARKQRLEGRHQRKAAEYNKRRHELRQERSQILTTIKESKEIGLDPSPDDLDQIKQIDARMARLVDLTAQEQLAKATVMADPSSVVVPEPVEVKCDECGATQPEDSKAGPEHWLRGHKMGAHRKAG